MRNMRETAMGLLSQGIHKCEEDTGEALFMSGLIGSQWKHQRNGNIYTIVGFSWSGDLDEWCVVHERPYFNVQFNRTFSNFFGFIDGVNLRYAEV